METKPIKGFFFGFFFVYSDLSNMKVFIIVVIFFRLVLCQGHGKLHQLVKISSDELAVLGQFKFHVLIQVQKSEESICGGSAIASNWVLTVLLDSFSPF